MTNEVRIEHQRMIKIALNDTNRSHFDLFEKVFRDLLSKGKISSRDIRYSSQRPFSCVVNASLKDEVLKLAEKLPANIIELSEYDLDTETGEIVDGSQHILFPEHNKEIDSYEEEIKDDAEYDYADDDDLIDSNDDDEDYDWYSDSSGDDYYIPSNTVTAYTIEDVSEDVSKPVNNTDFNNDSRPTKIENNVGGLSIDDLLPTADDIISNLSPVITGLPVTTNKDIIYTTNQYQSSIYTLYGLLGKSLANVKPSDLEREIENFKNNLHAEFIPEVNAYFNSQNKYESKVEELNNTSDHIKLQYEENFRLWLENQIQLLKAEYAKTNPDNTDEQIAYYLAENKPILDKLEHELFENKAKAKQALVREFTTHNGNDALSDALRFVMVKELSKDAINNLMSLYENSSEEIASPAAQTKITGNTTPVTMLSDDQFIDDDEYGDLSDIYHQENADDHDNDNIDETVSADDMDMPKSFADIDLTTISDADLIKMYEQEMAGKGFTGSDDDSDSDLDENTDNFLGNNVSEEDENISQLTNDFDDTDEIKMVSLTDDIGDTADDIEYTENTETDNSVADISSDDLIDIGQTGDIPLISLEDLESNNNSDSVELANDDISDIELSIRNDEPDLLVDNDESGEPEEFKYIEEDDFSIEEVEDPDNTTDNSKKRKDKKSKKTKKVKKSDNTDKPKKSGLKMWIIGGVVALVLAGVGGGTFLLLNQNNEPSQSQEAQQAEQRKQAEEFFNSIKDYIAVDKSIMIPIDNENVKVTIVALNIDGSILVEDADGNQHTVSYEAVKAYAEDMKSKSE
jgi:hypothetical protein